MTDLNLKALADPLMRAVVRSGAVRHGHPADADLAVRVMREELKALLFAPESGPDKWADERALALTGGSGLAMASLAMECIRRVVAERAP